MQVEVLLGGSTEFSFAIIEQDISCSAIQATELGEEAEFITAHDEVCRAVPIDIHGVYSVDGGQLGQGW